MRRPDEAQPEEVRNQDSNPSLKRQMPGTVRLNQGSAGSPRTAPEPSKRSSLQVTRGSGAGAEGGETPTS